MSKEFTGVGVAKYDYKVKYTDRFMELWPETLKGFNEFFYKCEDLKHFTKHLIEAAMRRSYGYEPVTQHTMLEGFGQPFVISGFDNKVYKPTKDNWKVVKDGEEPKCGIYLTIDTDKKVGIFNILEDHEEDYWDQEVDLDDLN